MSFSVNTVHWYETDKHDMAVCLVLKLTLVRFFKGVIKGQHNSYTKNDKQGSYCTIPTLFGFHCVHVDSQPSGRQSQGPTFNCSQLGRLRKSKYRYTKEYSICDGREEDSDKVSLKCYVLDE